MVTAEAAMVLPVLVALTAALAWVVTLGIAQVRLVDAAREAARLAARDEPAATVQRRRARRGAEGIPAACCSATVTCGGPRCGPTWARICR